MGCESGFLHLRFSAAAFPAPFLISGGQVRQLGPSHGAHHGIIGNALPVSLLYSLRGSSAFGLLQMLKALPDQAHGPLVAYAMMGFSGAQLPLFWILTS